MKLITRFSILSLLPKSTLHSSTFSLSLTQFFSPISLYLSLSPPHYIIYSFIILFLSLISLITLSSASRQPHPTTLDHSLAPASSYPRLRLHRIAPPLIPQHPSDPDYPSLSFTKLRPSSIHAINTALLSSAKNAEPPCSSAHRHPPILSAVIHLATAQLAVFPSDLTPLPPASHQKPLSKLPSPATSSPPLKTPSTARCASSLKHLPAPRAQAPPSPLLTAREPPHSRPRCTTSACAPPSPSTQTPHRKPSPPPSRSIFTHYCR